jgi:acyl dehydratase/NAD(P)-dependent dehydrogenase (short-subunit alcohol dehydrogenase family)
MSLDLERNAMATLRIPYAIVRAFADASGDVNPLHVSGEYAAKSPFGGVVAHGVLSFLVAATALRDSLNDCQALAVRFHSPIFPDTTLRVEAHIAHGARSIAVFDGSRLLLEARVSTSYEEEERRDARAPTSLPLDEALNQPSEWINRESSVGPYWPDVGKIREVLLEFGDVRIPEWLIVQLSSLSFCVGMVFPGERALLRSIEVQRPTSVLGPINLSIAAPSATAVGRGLAKLLVSATVVHNVASEQVIMWQMKATAGIRRDPIPISPITRSDEPLRGKTALIVGGSRGFGAALKEGLIGRGCRTFVIQRTPSKEGLGSELSTTITADASSRQSMESVRRDIAFQVGEIDYFFLNATGVLHPMRLELDHVDRIMSYVSRELATSLHPLAAFAPLLRAGGTCVYSSTQGLAPERNGSLAEEWVDWPHYIAAKASIEGLIDIASLQFPEVRFIVARLPTLDTGLTLRNHVAPGHAVGPLADALLEAWTIGNVSPYDRTNVDRH